MPCIRIKTDKPIAFDSPDHLYPYGTARDNSVNLKFNKKLFRLFPPFQIKVLDLGCAGGGFVKSILDQGGFAVGIEGSDYSKKMKRAEWVTIPEYLFTADITEPFQLYSVEDSGKERPLKFNVVTAWEFMEHIREDKIKDVLENISRHLSPGGIVILSVCMAPDVLGGPLGDLSLHQTVKNKRWWLGKFLQLGFKSQVIAGGYFGGRWVRRSPGSFNLVMTRASGNLPCRHKLYLLLFPGMIEGFFILLIGQVQKITFRIHKIIEPLKRFLQ